jgi:hypothetical protein
MNGLMFPFPNIANGNPTLDHGTSGKFTQILGMIRKTLG